MSDLIQATVTLGRNTIPVYLKETQHAKILARMLARGGAVTIEQVFEAPSEDEGNFEPEIATTPPRKQRNGDVTPLRKASHGTSSGTCRGISQLPDIKHGPPGRGQAHGFCPECIKLIPRSLRLDMYEKAKAAKNQPSRGSEPETGAAGSDAD